MDLLTILSSPLRSSRPSLGSTSEKGVDKGSRLTNRGRLQISDEHHRYVSAAHQGASPVLPTDADPACKLRLVFVRRPGGRYRPLVAGDTANRCQDDYLAQTILSFPRAIRPTCRLRVGSHRDPQHLLKQRGHFCQKRCRRERNQLVVKPTSSTTLSVIAKMVTAGSSRRSRAIRRMIKTWRRPSDLARFPTLLALRRNLVAMSLR